MIGDMAPVQRKGNSGKGEGSGKPKKPKAVREDKSEDQLAEAELFRARMHALEG